MHALREEDIQCPYCGETISILVDCTQDYQDYIEDCQVCCRPIKLIISINESGAPDVKVLHENECG